MPRRSRPSADESCFLDLRLSSRRPITANPRTKPPQAPGAHVGAENGKKKFPLDEERFPLTQANKIHSANKCVCLTFSPRKRFSFNKAGWKTPRSTAGGGKQRLGLIPPSQNRCSPPLWRCEVAPLQNKDKLKMLKEDAAEKKKKSLGCRGKDLVPPSDQQSDDI